MKKNKNMKKVITSILSIIIVIILNLKYSIHEKVITIGNENIINSFLLILGAYYVLKEILMKKNDKRKIIFSIIIGCIFTLMSITRLIDFVNTMMNMEGIAKTYIAKTYILYSILKFISLWIILSSIVLKIFNNIDDMFKKDNECNESIVIKKVEKYFLGKGIISIILIAIFIAILYLPYMLNYYPGRSS